MRNEIRLYVVVLGPLVAWIYHTGFIFLSLCSLKALRWLQCVHRAQYKGNDVVQLVAWKDHYLLNFDLQNLSLSLKRKKKSEQTKTLNSGGVLLKEQEVLGLKVIMTV